jgi:hypothetical protein
MPKELVEALMPGQAWSPWSAIFWQVTNHDSHLLKYTTHFLRQLTEITDQPGFVGRRVG